jgi:hypothetical protein
VVLEWRSPNVTASAIISFAEKLEDDSSKFYKQLTEKYVENKELFLSFAEESRKNKVLVIPFLRFNSPLYAPMRAQMRKLKSLEPPAS